MLVLLDVDGTLVDTNYLHVDAWARAFHTLGMVVPRAAIHRQVGKGSDQFLPYFLKDKKQWKRADRLHLRYYAQVEKNGFALPGARELIEALKSDGHSLWIATSGKPKELKERLKTLRVDEALFDGVVSSGDVKRSKPYPDIFRTVLKRAGVRPKDAAVIGDTLWDVQAARRARIRSFALLSGGAFSGDELEAAGAAAVFEDCEELLDHGFALFRASD
jgi:HAD superfamily hydrolase (TIGR01509 family)